jgi:hypothetical protein
MLHTFDTTFANIGPLGHGRNLPIFILGAIFAIVCIIVAITAEWKLFEKAGRPGWAAIVPLYNSWVLFEISGKPGWWVLIGLIPYLGWLILFVLTIIAMIELARRFDQSTMFAIVGLVIFQVVGFLILGFGDAEYRIPPEEKSFNKPSSE